MEKRATYKTIGWVLLGAGVTCFGTAYLINVENGWNGPTKAEGLFTAGFVAAAASPPFFILAAINKRKVRLVLTGERLSSVILFDKPPYPAVSLRINL